MKNLKLIIIALFVPILFCANSCSDSEKTPTYTPTGTTQFTYADAIEAYDAFVSNLFSEGRGVYKRDTHSQGEIAVGWTQSMMFDMSLNAYQLTDDQKYLDLAIKHFKGCEIDFTFDWYDYNHWDLYDDMMWWVGSLARAYLVTKDENYLNISKEGFKRVWYGKPVSEGGDVLDAKGSYGGDTGGGMYWDWKFGRTGKMACICYPTVIAALELYEATGDVDYLDKAKDIYQWSYNNLFNKTTGAVADSKHDGNLNPAWTMLIYNQATCIGSAAKLYLVTDEQAYLDQAILAMDYVVANKSTANKILIPEGKVDQSAVEDEMGIYNSILAQYLPILIVDCGQDQYLEYIERSINFGWENRDPKRNLTNKFLEKAPISSSALSSYTATGVPALMLTFPDVKLRK